MTFVIIILVALSIIMSGVIGFIIGFDRGFGTAFEEVKSLKIKLNEADEEEQEVVESVFPLDDLDDNAVPGLLEEE